MGNFEFLEKVNPCVANLANTAEKLFRDEYYDQCIAQTRKMAEVMTRNVLGSKAQEDDTFDDMLYKLKTVSNNNFREQEFITDMYFLKKQGNIAVHSQKSENSGRIALECLEHAFEASVNYAYAITHSDKINKLIFDEKLLVLGEKNTSLQETYQNKIEEVKEEENKDDYINETKTADKPITKTKKSKKPCDKTTAVKTDGNNSRISLKIFAVSVILALTVLTVLSLISFFSKNSSVNPVKTVQKPAVAKAVTKTSKPAKQTKTSKPVEHNFSMSKTFSGINN